MSVERPKNLAFISYRRDDTRDWANLIADTLQRQFGAGTVFLDTDNIRLADQWSKKIENALEFATVVIPIIGPKWLFLQNPDDGRRRLDSEHDWVRREIEHALTEEKELLPVTVSGARLPAANQLPPSIQELPSRQALRVAEKRDVEALVEYLANHCGFKKLKVELDYPTPVDRPPELSENQVAEALGHLPGWEIQQRDSQRGREGVAVELVATLKFDGFEDAIHFMNSASRYISRTDHHPFWENQYKDLRIRITTWDVGMRISPKDIRLASYLQWLYREYTPGERPSDVPYTA
jgi:pterin-4a-carbinolamine dehydratase